jgi:hypothetical protein
VNHKALKWERHNRRKAIDRDQVRAFDDTERLCSEADAIVNAEQRARLQAILAHRLFVPGSPDAVRWLLDVWLTQPTGTMTAKQLRVIEDFERKLERGLRAGPWARRDWKPNLASFFTDPSLLPKKPPSRRTS